MDESIRRCQTAVLMLVAGASICLSVQVVASSSTLTDAFRQQHNEQTSGAGVWEIAVSDQEVLEPASCEALEQRSTSIIDSGAVLDQAAREPFRIAATGAELPTVDLTPGALRVWWPNAPAEAGPLLGQDLRHVAALETGVPLLAGGAQAVVGADLPVYVAPAALQASLVRVSPALGFSHLCWARMTPGIDDSTAREVVEAAFPNNNLVVKRFLEEDPLRPSPAAIASRQHWDSLGIGAFVFLLLGALAGWIDRKELGVYRVTGSTTADLSLMWLIQLGLILSIALTTALTTTLAVMALNSILPIEPQVVWYMLHPALPTLLSGGLLMFASYGWFLRAPVSEQLRP